MSEYTATVEWQLDSSNFTDNRYSRLHHWHFDGGITVPASAAPQVVPAPLSVAAAVDPEEAFVASLASCHMLWFLSLAAKAGYSIEKYRDQARGEMRKNAEGKQAITLITLYPEASFTGDKLPSIEQLNDLHHAAHEHCFIAASIKSEVRIEPILHAAN